MLDRRKIPLAALRAFECAGRHQNFSRAGEELGVTHGAISHQVRALEEQLNSQLFIRSSNRLQLTSAGERLLAAVSDGFDRIVEGTLNLNPDTLTGKLVIGCPASTAARWAARYVCQFQQLYPEIQIELVEIKPHQKQIPRELDLALCYGEPMESSRRTITNLMKVAVFPVCSPRILHGKAVIKRVTDLLDYPLLEDHTESWRRWFKAVNIIVEEPLQLTRFFSTHLSLDSARKGFGIALGNHFEVEENLRDGSLVKAMDKSIPDPTQYYLVTNTKENQTVREHLFEDWIKKAINENTAKIK